MPDNSRFINLDEAARRIGRRGPDLTQADLRDLLCRDCDFFDDEHDDELECSCFQMLATLLRSGALTPRGLSDAVETDG